MLLFWALWNLFNHFVVYWISILAFKCRLKAGHRESDHWGLLMTLTPGVPSANHFPFWIFFWLYAIVISVHLQVITVILQLQNNWSWIYLQGFLFSEISPCNLSDYFLNAGILTIFSILTLKHQWQNLARKMLSAIYRSVIIHLWSMKMQVMCFSIYKTFSILTI